MFTKIDHDVLAPLVFKEGYPGYKPAVKEIPNGDGLVDSEKRYAHVAPKYLAGLSGPDHLVLDHLYRVATRFAKDVAEMAGVPAAFAPDERYGALRVLEYPPGAISNCHEDFDLFTLMLYRDQPDRFVSHDKTIAADILHLARKLTTIDKIRILNPQAHLGQLGEAFGLGKATPHEVLASDTTQHSIVYFAIPDHDAVLPSGQTVREFLNERMARSRTEFKEYI